MRWSSDGLLERRRYSAHPPRYEYVPTQRGREFAPVLVALLAWGNRHFAADGVNVQIVDTATGAAVDPIFIDRKSNRPIAAPEFTFAAGPAAPERTRRRYARGSQTLSGISANNRKSVP